MNGETRICRFCGHSDTNLLKYGVRHYAHAACGLFQQGGAFLEHFTPWQLNNQFPYLVAKRFGVEKLLEQLAAEDQKKGAA